MSSVIKTRFILVGALAGKTINLGSLPYKFIDGAMELIATPEDTKLHAHFVEVNWQAYPEGHPKLKEAANGQRDIQEDSQPNAESSVQGAVQPNGEGTETSVNEADARTGSTEAEAGGAGSVPAGDGPEAELNTKLQRAVHSLDPAIDEHWTIDGKPAITAVVAAYGSNDVTRAAVEAAAPGFTRKAAQPFEE